MSSNSLILFREIYNDFLALLSREETNANNIRLLSIFLDRLSSIYHSTDNIQVEKSEEAEGLKYENVRSIVIKHFPNLGLYNVPQSMTRELGQTKILIGDAIDDITDIVCDLSQVVWYIDHTNENNALWFLRFGFENHWGKHLRELQLYLHNLQHYENYG